jgi:hypothetical protein
MIVSSLWRSSTLSLTTFCLIPISGKLWQDPIRGDVDNVAREAQVPVDFNDASH